MIPLLALKPSGSRDRSGVITPSKAGALRVVGDAYLIEEGTTNLLVNPLVANATTGITLTAEVTASRDASYPGVDIGAALRVVAAITGSFRGARFSTASLGATGVAQAYTASVAFAGASGTIPSVNTQIAYTDSTFTPGAAASVSLNPVLSRSVLAAVVANPAKTITLVQIVAQNTTTPLNLTWWEYQPQIEAKDHPTTFCPQYDESGILLPGYTWSGTPHASSSTRAAASLAAPLPSTWQSMYVRYHEGDGVEHNIVLTDEGMIGDYGVLTVADDTATITSNRALYLGAALFYDRALTAGEIAKLDATPTALLGWGTLQQQSGILRIGDGIALPGIVRVGR